MLRIRIGFNADPDTGTDPAFFVNANPYTDPDTDPDPDSDPDPGFDDQTLEINC